MDDNTADDGGGSFYFEAGSSVEIVHATIAGSFPNLGSAIANHGSTVVITNTIIASHEIGIDSQVPGYVSEDYNLFYSNQTNFSGPVNTGSNSLIGDPLFIDVAGGDFHLGEGSPGVDTGLDLGILVDLDGNARPLGSKPDRGAYETSGEFNIYLPALIKPV